MKIQFWKAFYKCRIIAEPCPMIYQINGESKRKKVRSNRKKKEDFEESKSLY